MRNIITTDQYVADFIAINEFRVVRIIHEQFGDNIDRFFSAPAAYERFINLPAFQKAAEYKQIGNIVYGDIFAYNLAGWNGAEMTKVLGARNYHNAEWMQEFRSRLTATGLVFHPRGVLRTKDTNHPYPPKWLPSKRRVEELFADKDGDLWAKSDDGKFVVNYNTKRLSKRAATILKKMLGVKGEKTFNRKGITMKKTKRTKTTAEKAEFKANHPGSIPTDDVREGEVYDRDALKAKYSMEKLCEMLQTSIGKWACNRTTLDHLRPILGEGNYLKLARYVDDVQNTGFNEDRMREAVESKFPGLTFVKWRRERLAKCREVVLDFITEGDHFQRFALPNDWSEQRRASVMRSVVNTLSKSIGRVA